MPDPAALKVATYNVNGIRPRLPALLEWLAREQPDVACLQELKAADEAFPVEDIHDAGYGALWHGQRSWNGVAILARGAQPVERRRGLPGDEGDEQSRYLEAEVHGLVVGCLYLPNGNPQPGPKFDYKLAWFERLIEHASHLLASGEPVVLAGDFNVVPTDEDIYNPRSWRKDALLQPESRDCYSRLLAQGWIDALRAAHPDERIYTFWDYFRDHWPRNAGLRIDHLLLGNGLASRLIDADVDRWVRDRPSPSDHAPTWVRLRPAAGSGAVDDREPAETQRPAATKTATPAATRAGSKPATKKTVGTKTATKKAATKKTAARKTVVKKAIVKKMVVRKAAAEKTVTRKTAAKRASANTGAKAAPASRKSAARKVAAKKTGRAAAVSKTGAMRKAASKRVAAPPTRKPTRKSAAKVASKPAARPPAKKPASTKKR
ncbi:exodeoxyribonuclease III [Lysobacter korlensis]|uniref:Exodeoxyribonuclease III n=1 Tax=Lysobacter korlensis TaxID=553636 RepID=A0ABV6RKX2_9GAMM